MRQTWFILVCVLVLTPVAFGADTVVVSGIKSAGVQVTGVDDCQLVFNNIGGVSESALLLDVGSIDLGMEPLFTEAEALAAAGKVVEADAKYRAAVRATTEDWVRDLCRYRRYQAIEAGGQVADAVRLWIDILEANDFSANAAGMVPTHMAPAGDEANTDALDALGELRGDEKVVDDDALWASVTNLMISLAQIEGLEAQQMSLTDELLERLPAGDSATLMFRLSAAASKINNGSPEHVASALEIITADIDLYTSEQLPEALFLRAEGYEKAAELASEDAPALARTRQLDACIDYMYVLVFFAYDDNAPEAAYRAAVLNEAIGAEAPARQLYRVVATGGMGLGANNDYTEMAEQALRRLDGQTESPANE